MTKMIEMLTRLSEQSQSLGLDPLKQPLINLTNCSDRELTCDANGNINKGDGKIVTIEHVKGLQSLKNIENLNSLNCNGIETKQIVENEINLKSNNDKVNGDICTVENNIENLNINKEKPIPTYEKYKFLWWEFETPIIWLSAFFITLWHVIAVYHVFAYPLSQKIRLAVYATVIGGISGFGVTGGAHRYFTHKSYKAKTPLKIILLICYSCAGQNTIYDWVRDHRGHHKFSETDADPHNAKRGFFFSHVGWLMMKKHPDVIKQGRKLDLSDLTDDPLIAFHIRHWVWFKFFFCFFLPTMIPVVWWGESFYWSMITICFIRYTISLNSTWAVNSFAHLYGNRPYDKQIYPVENLAVSFFAMGEGYHNYHHTFPWDYRAAELGQMLNVTTLWLNIFQKIGWAYNLKAPTSELIQRVATNKGDGSHYRWGHEVPETCNGSAGKGHKDQ